MLFSNNGELKELPFRQIHMDFHTSDLIADVAKNFDPERFADTLSAASVNQVCCFARCHHGWLYYRSQAHPERMHPTLTNRDMLAQQVDACHKRGIRVPIYTTVQWDNYSSSHHADWQCQDIHGRSLDMVGRGNGPKGFYTYLCVRNEDYVQFLEDHIKDIYESITVVDGIFLDIMWQIPCACPACWASMESIGMNPLLEKDRYDHALITLDRFMSRMSSYIKTFDKHASIYYNNGCIWPGRKSATRSFTHLEFDALPGESGYRSIHHRRYDRTLDLDCVAMTGKFHRGWGDFHSFKNREALEYECFLSLALGFKCLVGDQLHPMGELEPAVYDLIGSVYSQIEKKEPWCQGARPVVDIGLFSAGGSGGAVSMLDTAAHQFDIIDQDADFNKYNLIILPDKSILTKELAERIDAYVVGGGRLLCSFEAGYSAPNKSFTLDCMPVVFSSDGPIFEDGLPVRGRYLQRTNYADYVIPSDTIGASLPKAEHVMYSRGMEVSAKPDAQVLLWQIKPYFDRTQARFSSHQQIPSSGEQGYPVVVKRGNVIYFGHPIFDIYESYAPRWVREMVLDAINLLLPCPALRHQGPTTLEAFLNYQEAEDRYVVHLLHYIPLNRSKHLEVVEDVIPLYNLPASVKIPHGRAVKSISLVPCATNLDFEYKEDRVEFVVPEVRGHQMVEICLCRK